MLLIIHIYKHTDISETRDKNTSVRITDYIITDEFIQIHRTELPSHLAQQPNIYHLQMVTNNYLSVQSTDTTLGGQPNL